MTTMQVSSDATKLLKLANALTPKIEHLRAPRQENTPKRQCQAMSARCEATNLELVQRALFALAKGWETGEIPEDFKFLRTRTAVEPLVTKITDHPSYYVVCLSSEFRSMDPIAVALRRWIAEREGDDWKKHDQDRALANRIKAMEEAIRFQPIPGFFPTPPELVSRMIDLAEISSDHWCTDPSAGKGDIIDAVKRRTGAICTGSEINPQLAQLCSLKGFSVECEDFLTRQPEPMFDRILMNPPFENGQDMEHVRRAYDWLRPGGRIVAIVSPGFTMNRGEKFKSWLHEIALAGGGFVATQNEPEAFKGAFRSTGVATFTLVVNKP